MIGNALASRSQKRNGVYKGRPLTFDRARIVALRKEGMGATEIAKAVGCERGNVYKALKAAGLNWARRRSGGAPLAWRQTLMNAAWKVRTGLSRSDGVL